MRKYLYSTLSDYCAPIVRYQLPSLSYLPSEETCLRGSTLEIFSRFIAIDSGNTAVHQITRTKINTLYGNKKDSSFDNSVFFPLSVRRVSLFLTNAMTIAQTICVCVYEWKLFNTRQILIKIFRNVCVNTEEKVVIRLHGRIYISYNFVNIQC